MFDSLRKKLDTFVQKTISEKDLDSVLWELEVSLLESDVSMKASEKMIETLKSELVGSKVGLTERKKNIIQDALKNAVTQVLNADSVDLEALIKEKNRKDGPLVILFVGFNGTGKTTTIAKLAHILKQKHSVVIAASDTFRAGSQEQLEKHAERVGVRVVKHGYGADPAAVAFDAIKHARAKDVDVVLIDTAGRAETNKNLMEQMKKIKRVTSPDLTIFVGDALAGNAAVEQAEKFGEVGIDASILTKIDADARGGAALSISYITGRPIIYVGNGQEYDDLQPFNSEWLLDRLVS
ncbi:MAG: signal recognition particle-docking protein FtsY [Theionarchaea archaeon]|nr:signal recognition particle-docking protein FtsY [Theionarchaea archaeon]MBU7000758.1 signal recognition particle-docking protein FtsY [Theionarchaea archaeon]MBU7021459.1 signal recognition particle-docking protein FtsY [Theionarchaea archaeon]MBU7033600.1 signal recognition particle-docking protein FtsY [Theionarchaea archaeon]MBU7040721.1 signal recognition particle-docking protein FtsY [Theionarchaea archaeon]